MRAHPIIDYPYRWFPMLVLALVLAIIPVSYTHLTLPTSDLV